MSHELQQLSAAPEQEIEDNKIAPEQYPYGSRGPVGAHYLAAKHGVRWGDIVNPDELGAEA